MIIKICNWYGEGKNLFCSYKIICMSFLFKNRIYQHLKFNFLNFKSNAGKVIAHKIENEDWQMFNYGRLRKIHTDFRVLQSLSLSLFSTDFVKLISLELYNVVLVSIVQQSGSAIHIHAAPLLLDSLPLWVTTEHWVEFPELLVGSH